MEIDIKYSLIYYTTNVCIGGYNWRGYGLGLWYDTRIETYEQARKRVREIVWDGIYIDHPHLKGTDFMYTESGEIPVIQEKDR